MMKKHTLLLGALALVLTLSACGGKPTAAPAELDPAATAQALLDSAAFSEPLEPLEADLVGAIYGLEEDALDAAVYLSTGATAEEIAVLTMKDEAAATAALAALEARVAAQKDACEGYLPAELPKLDQAILEQSGCTVLLVVAADAQAAQGVLDGLTQP